MKRMLCIIAPLLLAGCSSFHLGSLAYCAWGEGCEFKAKPPERAASAPTTNEKGNQ